MKRSKLKNLFNKNKTQETWCKYKIQRNYYVNILYKTKKTLQEFRYQVPQKILEKRQTSL